MLASTVRPPLLLIKCKSTETALASSVKRPRESVLYLAVSAYLTVSGFSVHPFLKP